MRQIYLLICIVGKGYKGSLNILGWNYVRVIYFYKMFVNN